MTETPELYPKVPPDHWYYHEGVPQNYPPNETAWRTGDLVLHDSDAKRKDMLMRVLGYTTHSLVLTEYVDAGRRRQWTRGLRKGVLMSNRLCMLHDPRRFGVTPTPQPRKDLPHA